MTTSASRELILWNFPVKSTFMFLWSVLNSAFTLKIWYCWRLLVAHFTKILTVFEFWNFLVFSKKRGSCQSLSKGHIFFRVSFEFCVYPESFILLAPVGGTLHQYFDTFWIFKSKFGHLVVSWEFFNGHFRVSWGRLRINGGIDSRNLKIEKSPADGP